MKLDSQSSLDYTPERLKPKWYYCHSADPYDPIKISDGFWRLSSAASDGDYLVLSTCSDIYVVRLPPTSEADPEISAVSSWSPTSVLSAVTFGKCHGVGLVEEQGPSYSLSLLTLIPPRSEIEEWKVLERELPLPVPDLSSWLLYDELSGRAVVTLDEEKRIYVLSFR